VGCLCIGIVKPYLRRFYDTTTEKRNNAIRFILSCSAYSSIRFGILGRFHEMNKEFNPDWVSAPGDTIDFASAGTACFSWQRKPTVSGR
jgi:hypothetical protein